MSKQLIYLAVFGPSMRPLARACVQSLRAAGRFEGDIWVFSDHPPLGVEADHKPVGVRTEWQDICAARIELGLALPFEQYDAIAYVDADCLSTASIAPLFSGLERFRAAEDRLAMGASQAVNGGLTVAERRRADCPSVCAGIFGGESAVFRQALAAWKSVYDATPSNHFREQHALNALVYRNGVPISLYPRSVITPVYEELDAWRHAPLLHFWGGVKHLMLPAWERWRKRYHRRKPPRPDEGVRRMHATGLRRGPGAIR